MHFNKILLSTLTALLAFLLNAEEQQNLKPLLDAQKGNANINIPKGVYYLESSYTFENLKDVVFNGNGSEIICRKVGSAFKIKNCENFKLSDFSIDYQPLCYTQGVITELNRDENSITLRIFKGYALPKTGDSTDQGVRIFSPKTKALIENYITIHGDAKIKELEGERMFKLYKPAGAKNINSENVGDIVVIKTRGGGHTFHSEDSKNLYFKNITIYGSPSFSMYEHNCSNSTYDACILTAKKDDATVEYPRLCAGNADGIHIQNAPIGPKVRNCVARDLGDDAITITSRYYPIYEVDEKSSTIYVVSRQSPVFAENDSLIFLDFGGKIMGKVKCAKLEIIDFDKDKFKEMTKLYNYGFISETGYKYATKVTLSSWIPGLKAGDIFNSPEHSGQDFVIENNFAGFTRARGIFVKASNGVIRNNTVEACELAGIVLSQELNYMSGGAFYNVEISNNTIKNCLFGKANAQYYQAGALSVVSMDGRKLPSPTGAFQNIIIKDNTIENSPKPCVYITSVDGLIYENNKVSPSDKVRNWGEKVGVTYDEPVLMENVKLKKK